MPDGTIVAHSKRVRLGAYDYLVKPLDFEALKHTLEKAIEHSRLSVENRELRRQLTDAATRPGILGRSQAVKDMLHIISTVAPTEATVLITGESGTGKELVARALHEGSARADKPLVTVNCAALAENLLESELFGHEKGSFTGAERRREGRFVQANGGTLFLDEIGEMPMQLQAKLLRALQQGEVQRVGSDSPITVNVRVLAATNRDLRLEAAQKRFREDLYFRLNVISIDVPPLRQRGEDIPLLAAHFLQRFAGRNRKSIKGFAPQALDSMLRYPWPDCPWTWWSAGLLRKRCARPATTRARLPGGWALRGLPCTTSCGSMAWSRGGPAPGLFPAGEQNPSVGGPPPPDGGL